MSANLPVGPPLTGRCEIMISEISIRVARQMYGCALADLVTIMFTVELIADGVRQITFEVADITVLIVRPIAVLAIFLLRRIDSVPNPVSDREAHRK